jgi:hypothetical protein
MALSSDDLVRIQQAAALGTDPNLLNMEITPEVQATYDAILGEINAVEERTMISPLGEWPDDTYDELLENTYAAHGRPKTLAEMRGEEATLVSKAVEERMFTLGPMYIPNVKDAHAEWTDPDELQKAVWDYVAKGDRRIRLQHDRDVVAGEWVEIMAWPYEVEAPIIMKDATQSTLKFPANTVFLGVKWEPWAWSMIKEGKLRGYSIGGRAERLLADLPEEYVGKAQAPFEDAVRVEADDVAPRVDEKGLEEKIAAAVAEAMKSINPVVNVVMPDDKPKVRRVERDEHGNILRVIEE